MTFRLTASGAAPEGATKDSGAFLELERDAVEVSLLALPRMKVPPVAASARPAPPITKARVSALAAAGCSDRRARAMAQPVLVAGDVTGLIMPPWIAAQLPR